MQSICADCGDTYDKGHGGAYCDLCRPATDHIAVEQQRRARLGQTTRQRGYGAAWRKLSRRARAAQPFCTDCGTPEDLTTDHSRQAWERVAAGKTVRLEDVDVVCRRCNSERGAARGSKASDEWRSKP